MALKIRLRQQGCNNRQTFRVVVADVRSKRDGKYVEKLGWYLPHLTADNCKLDEERLQYWLDQGALMSEQVEFLAGMVTPDLLKKYKAKKEVLRLKMAAKRRAVKRKATAKKK